MAEDWPPQLGRPSTLNAKSPAKRASSDSCIPNDDRIDRKRRSLQPPKHPAPGHAILAGCVNLKAGHSSTAIRGEDHARS
jgi:hypothetical protein